MSGGEEEKSERKLMVIDTDAGVDDALAILLALTFKDEWQTLAITCCHGNVEVDTVCQNVMKILVECNHKEIAVYRGCEQSLVSKYASGKYHGEDGFGNVSDQFSTEDMEVSKGHAVNILTKLAKEYPRQITLVAIGPLTNVAMAHRMDPEFTKNLKRLVIMGGNIHGEGNVTDAAEFNFLCDPEAAHIVLTESSCSVCMIPWETTMNHGMKWDLYWEWIRMKTKKGKFVKTITAYMAKCLQEAKQITFEDCDFLAMAAALCPESIEETISHPVSVETSGVFTRGQAIIERLQSSKSKFPEKPNIEIITKFSDSLLNELRNKIVQS